MGVDGRRETGAVANKLLDMHHHYHHHHHEHHENDRENHMKRKQ